MGRGRDQPCVPVHGFVGIADQGGFLDASISILHFTITLAVTLHLRPLRSTNHAGAEPR